jgi:hypothetical protein
MPPRFSRHIVLDRREDEPVRMRLRIVVIMRVVIIMVQTGGRSRGPVQRSGVDRRADRVRP